ncbi:MAG: polysaccharide deacetylase family protein [Verrucomicrobiota bacterium]
MDTRAQVNRRRFLQSVIGAAAGAPAFAQEKPSKAQIAITLDLEMARNFPRWEDTHWDYEKGNLDAATRRYAVEAARRVRARGGHIHFFLVARALEQNDVSWLKDIIQAGHAVGNHTYDHANLLAKTPEQTQFRFQKEPALVAGKSVPEILRDNIDRATRKMQERLGVRPVGFRTPGGFAHGLTGREDLQRMLRELGFDWVSSRYPAHSISKPGTEPGPEVFDSIIEAQAAAQPFKYPTGLVEIPMSPISDIGAFRNCRWPLPNFLKAIRRAVNWCIEHGAVFDFLGHPACLNVVDPEFQAIDLICRQVEESRGKAELATLDQIARRA